MSFCRHAVRWLSIATLLGCCPLAMAGGFFSFGDLEKPKPQFQRNGPEIAAQLIPRAKSTSVVIAFGVSDNGTLDNVTGIDFETVERPEVDVKNFKSAVFQIQITKVKPGGTVALSVRSDFFTPSTAFYVYNPQLEKPWIDAHAENHALAGRIQELVIPVADGGTFDADGQADGKMTVIGGPRDSFWGYALGTLFIRFFGIFIVLSVLMIGMIVSGWFFKIIDQTKKRTISGREEKTGAPAGEQNAIALEKGTAVTASDVPEEVAAAIGAALHLHVTALQRTAQGNRAAAFESTWAREGRQRLMNDRLSVFSHLKGQR